MAYDGWMNYNGVDIVNIARTSLLAETLGIDAVWTTSGSVSWVGEELDGALFGVGPFGVGGFGSSDTEYTDIATAPWYDPGVPASSEFAGVVPLAVEGLDDSSLTSTTTEFVTDGGKSGRPRNGTQALVFSAALAASTDRGAEFGKRWLARVLRTGTEGSTICAGADLRYFRFAGPGADVVHRRKVRVTRGLSITRKTRNTCSTVWMVTFTLTADDPYEYGEAVRVLDDLGGATPTSPESTVQSYGSTALVKQGCPVYNYTPIYDPLYPALVPSPTAPDFYPAGWEDTEGATFDRYWARIAPVEPSDLRVVPVVILSTDVDARMVRVQIRGADAEITDQCEPLFDAVLSYQPAGTDFYVDGEQQASYVWDGVAPFVRRTDSLVYSGDAQPIEWAAFNDDESLLVTLDVFSDSTGMEGEGTVRASLVLVPKSD